MLCIEDPGGDASLISGLLGFYAGFIRDLRVLLDGVQRHSGFYKGLSHRFKSGSGGGISGIQAVGLIVSTAFMMFPGA